jgi:hypothetical protein
MTKLFLILSFFLAFIFQSQAQSQERKILIEDYIQRSEKQKKTGLIMLGTGVGSVIIGTVLFGTGWSDGSDFAAGSGAILMAAGSITTLISIPILVSSASNGRKAAKLGIGTARLSEPIPNGFYQKSYPALHFSIPIHSQKP